MHTLSLDLGGHTAVEKSTRFYDRYDAHVLPGSTATFMKDSFRPKTRNDEIHKRDAKNPTRYPVSTDNHLSVEPKIILLGQIRRILCPKRQRHPLAVCARDLFWHSDRKRYLMQARKNRQSGSPGQPIFGPG